MTVESANTERPPGAAREGAVPADEPSALVGTVVAERYRVEELLGHGGMGTVYRAEHVHMRKAVVLKVLHPEIAALEGVAARFEREAIAAGRIEHRNVAKAMDFGQLADGSFYLVMEYVKGETLSKLNAGGARPPGNALEIARQIAAAMQAAHEAGVVHRDLRPENVMVGERDARGDFVKVLDFGVAKLATDAAAGGSPITRYGVVIGAPEYMAPEQAGGGVVDHRADLYALGVILYELLSGGPPFNADDRAGILSKVLLEAPPALPASIPGKTRALVLELLAKDPDLRIQTAAELIERIGAARAEIESARTVFLPAPAALDGAAAKEPAASSTQRPRRRTPMIAAVTALALLALSIGASVVVFSGRFTKVESAMVPGAAAALELAPGTEASSRAVAESAATAAPEASALPEASEATETNAVPSARAAGNTSQEKSRTVTLRPRPGTKITITRRTIRRYTVKRR